MGKRRSIINKLHAMRLFDVLPRKHSLTVLSYHRVGRASSSSTFAFDSSVFGPVEEEFDNQMRWLAKNAEPVSERDVLQAIEGLLVLPKRSVLVTFDDAYKDQFHAAVPSLIHHKIPAIFFITPDLINKRSMGFWDRLARAIKLTTKDSIFVDDREFNLSEKNLAIKEITSFVKNRIGADPYELTTQIESLCDIATIEKIYEDAELMTWDEIKLIDKKRDTNGLSIGAHGFTHRLLGTLTPEEQKWELRSAKESLEKVLGHDIYSVAYPAGSFTSDTPKIALDCGYSAQFTFESGINWSRLDPLDIKRIPAGDTTAIVACSASLPWALGASFYP